MSKRSPKSTHKSVKKTHPGSSLEDARLVSGRGDFGAAESDVIERNYTSANTKLSDRGGAPPPRAGADDSRIAGAGGRNSGTGSSSGGDLDTDIVGVGTGGSGIAASGKVHEPKGPVSRAEPAPILRPGRRHKGRGSPQRTPK